MGVRQKAPALLANRRGGRGRGLEVVVPEERDIPRMPSAPAGVRWGRRTRALWRTFWQSPVSLAVDPNADAERLFRWMEAIDERDRLLADVRRDGYAPTRRVVAEFEDDEKRVIEVVEGAHPHLAYIKHLDREIARLSEHFGATPLSRFRLQLTFAVKEQAGRRLQRERKRDISAENQEDIDLRALG